MKDNEKKNMENLALQQRKYTYEDLQNNEKNIYTLPKTYEITEDIKVNILKDCTISLKDIIGQN